MKKQAFRGPLPDVVVKLKSSEIWQGMITVLRPDFWTLFAIAAPFTVLVDMTLTLFGPDQPRIPAEYTPRTIVILILIPGLIGAIAQLAVAHMIAHPGKAPRAALAAGLAALPAYLAALFLSVLPTGLGFALLIIPGLYVTARLFLMVPIAVVERLGPIPLLKRSWALTEGEGWVILWFLVLAIFFVLGAGLLAQGVGAALGSVLTLLGIKAVGSFLASLVSATVTAVFSIASAAASTIIYLKLR